jgi:hypothetical protein
MSRGICGAVAAFAMMLVGPSSALGAIRYAEVSPGDGDPAVCAQADPCALEIAAEHPSVNNGDEVVVLPGTYNLGTGSLGINDEISVHGAAGGPRPIVTASGSGTLFTDPFLSNIEIRDLELVSTGTGPALLSSGNGAMGVTVERVVARASAAGTQACRLRNTLIRDSVCHNTAAGPAAGIVGGGLSGGGVVTLRNVTAYAPAGTAFDITAQSGATIIWAAKNVIARGGSVDITVEEQAGGDLTFTLENANFDTQSVSGGATVTSPSNQTAAPLLVDPDDGDYRQGPGSPTIDAGAAADLLGTADLDGDQRTIDGNCDGIAAPDIGADEFNVECPVAFPPEVGDTTAPTATITQGPKDKTKKKQATFTFSGSDARAVASFQCSLDGGAFTSCTSPYTVKVKKGKHTFQVRAVDDSGNVGAPASDSWKRKKKRKK